jgi:hypothetical protein
MKKNVLVLLVALFGFNGVVISADVSCTVTNGVVTFPDNDTCVVEPDYYSITLYELMLCTAEPVAPTATSTMDLSMCQSVWNNEAGSSVVVQQGVNSPLVGVITRPLNGSYLYGYARLDKDFVIKGSLKFNKSIVADSGDGSGIYCATKTTTSLVSTIVCGSTPQTAGTLTSPLVAMGDSPYLAIGTDRNLNAYIVDSSRQLSTSTSDAAQLIGVQAFTTPVVIKDSSVNMDVSFEVSKGLSIDDWANNTAGNASFVRGPFSMSIAVQ